LNDTPIAILLAVLFVLLALSAFFSASETSMMALNRYRLRHLASKGNRNAKRTAQLLANTDKLLGVILLGNNLINAASATLVTIISIRLFGNSEWVLGIATLVVTFAILVFSEVTPKVIGASYPEKIALPASFILRPLLSLAYPIVWFVNLFVQALLKLMRLQPNNESEHILGIEELRTLVYESGKLLPSTHKSILINLLDLEHITVNDVMTPRNQIEAIALDDDLANITKQLISSHHTRLPIYHEHPNEIIGMLHLRDITRDLLNQTINTDIILAKTHTPYFIPSGTLLFTQLRQFQENKRKLGLIVDEYGELQGLITLEDILEEIIGELGNVTQLATSDCVRQADGSWLVEGSTSIRHINRKLHLDLPEQGPKTLNGLILEHFEDIPEPGITLKITGHPIEIIQIQERAVKTARIYPQTPPT
jgi:Mg2+/Co2+ transporter CorB